MNDKPVGIVDSGIGGLSIFQEFVLQLPHESVIYLGDHANIPYGSKSEEEIYERSFRMLEFMTSRGAKLVIIACNTITVTCLDQLRKDFPELPIIGTVPVVKTAAAVTRSKHIGILSTTRTAESAYQKALIDQFAYDCAVSNIGTDRLVPMIEQGEIGSDAMLQIIREVVEPFKEAKVDTLALGCTHYPFIKDVLQQELGKDVVLLDSSAAISRHVGNVLQNNNARSKGKPTYQFYVTGDAAYFDGIAKKLLGSTIASTAVTL